MRRCEKFKMAGLPKSVDALTHLGPDPGRIHGFYLPFISERRDPVVFALPEKFSLQQIPGVTDPL